MVEGGLKADLLENRLAVTAAGCFIDKKNVPTQATVLITEQIGKQRAQGFEFSAVGKLAEPWSIIAKYSYIDSRIVNDPDPTLSHVRFHNIPYNAFNVWTRYNLMQRPEQTFGLAAGVIFVGERAGDLHDSFQLPGYTRYDAGVYYQRRNLSATVYFENIFDKEYYVSSVDNLTVFPGNPFTVRATVGVTF